MDEDGQLMAIFLEELEKWKPLEEISDREYEDKFLTFYNGVVNILAKQTMRGIKNDAAEIIKGRQDNRHNFEARLRNIWGRAFDLFEVFLACCIEAQAKLSRDIGPQIPEGKQNLYQALAKLHARGCLIGSEVFTLLLNGYPDGAIARWRSIQEINATAKLIAEHGDGLAERYLCYDIIARCKGVKEYQRHCELLGFKPYPEEKIAEMKAEKEEMCKRFGSNFEDPYGWANEVKKGSGFKAVEDAAGIGYMRPYYSMASRNIHAGPDGLDFRLGVPLEHRVEHVLMGPSDFGFADPACLTAQSLYQLTAAMLSTFKLKLWGIASIYVLNELAEEVISAFCEIEKGLQEQNTRS